MSDRQPDPAAREPTDEEPDLDRGVVEAWAARMISNPERAYRAGFYTATIFFIVTTLFPFFWLFVIAVTPRSNLSDIGVFTPAGTASVHSSSGIVTSARGVPPGVKTPMSLRSPRGVIATINSQKKGKSVVTRKKPVAT